MLRKSIKASHVYGIHIPFAYGSKHFEIEFSTLIASITQHDEVEVFRSTNFDLFFYFYCVSVTQTFLEHILIR